MFEKRPIWGVIFGLNVCVLIWLISVQQPVMYDASTALISSGNGESLPGNVAAAALQRGGRDDRDLREQQTQYIGGKHLQTSNNNKEVASTLNIPNLNSININSLENHTEETITTATNAISHSPNIHSLTSSLGTGVLNMDKLKPTPSWIKLTAVTAALPNEDFNRLIDLQQFHYIVPQPVCSSEIEALILVHSAPKNQEKRQIIRDTWASIGRHHIATPLRVIFLLGAVADELLQQSLVRENNEFGDMIQGSFIDDYRNMTYKHVMAFKWFLYNCPEAQLLIKVDDDVYVNTPQLIRYLKQEQKAQPQQQAHNQKQHYLRKKSKKLVKADVEEEEQQKQQTNENPTIITLSETAAAATKTTKKSLYDTLGNFAKNLIHVPLPENNISARSSSSSSPAESPSTSNTFKASQVLFHQPQNLLFCQKIIGSLVKRSYRSKWRVGFKEYSERYYPPYCPGYAIIYSADVVFRLYTAAQNSKYFWIDDVQITGVLAQQTNTTITTSSHYVLYSDECERLLTGKTDLNDMEFLFAWHSISAQQIKALWHLQMMSLPTLDDLQYKKRRRGQNGGGGGGGEPSGQAAAEEDGGGAVLTYNTSNQNIATEDFR